MIINIQGDIFASSADVLVNPVNTVGVSGKGLALEFAKNFPENQRSYEQACADKRVRLGELFTTFKSPTQAKTIVNFPTKGHWKFPSKIKWIEKGLDELAIFIEDEEIMSIAIPALGCGEGKLMWSEVRPLIEATLSHFDGTDIYIYEYIETPEKL